MKEGSWLIKNAVGTSTRSGPYKRWGQPIKVILQLSLINITRGALDLNNCGHHMHELDLGLEKIWHHCLLCMWARACVSMRSLACHELQPYCQHASKYSLTLLGISTSVIIISLIHAEAPIIIALGKQNSYCVYDCSTTQTVDLCNCNSPSTVTVPQL